MSKTFKTIHPYTAPPYVPPPDDGTVMVPTMNYRRVPAHAAIIIDALKWWQASLAKNGMSLNPTEPNVACSEAGDWLVFTLDGINSHTLDRNSSDLRCYARTDTKSQSLGTLPQLIVRWKREAYGTGPANQK